MNEVTARKMVPVWAENESPAEERTIRRTERKMNRGWESFVRDHMITILILAAMIAEGAIIGPVTAHRVRKETEERLAAEYSAQLEAYKAEEAEKIQASYFQSGEASREAFLNQEIDAAALLAAAMKNDVQKGGIICNALARMMNSAYPDTMQEVAGQPQQWMFYSPDNKYTAHDREIAETLVRDYYDGVVPNGLTKDYVYGAWSESDYVLRNTWEFGSGTLTWRYQG